MVEDVQNQPAEKISHFLSRVDPLCEGNTERKRETKCKYMTNVVLYVCVCTTAGVTYNHAISTLKL